MSYTPLLKTKYEQTIVPELQKKLGLSNRMQVPKISKIVLNMGLGAANKNPKLLEQSLKELGLIAGQKAVATVAKNSISNFKLREGSKIGAKVTLRGNIMYDFLFRLLAYSLPRTRDFRGIKPRAFDAQGNYNLGIKEQTIFPEISIDHVQNYVGLNITFCTNTTNAEHSKALLDSFGFPFAKK